MEDTTWRLLDEEKDEDVHNRDELIRELKAEGRSSREIEEMLRDLKRREDE